MIRVLLHRVVLIVPILFGASIIVFAIIRLVPGDPAVIMLGLNATPKLILQIHQQLGLSQPVYVQYSHWIGGILHGNWGYDYLSGQPISGLLTTTLPVTGELVVLALGLAVALGVAIGSLAALYRGRLPDWVSQVISMIGISIPDFWLGIMLTLLFALVLGVLPSSGFTALTVSVPDNLIHMILPVVALASGLTAVLIRITRAAMLEVLGQEYIRFARASGVPEWRVVLHHGLRNAAAPILTVIGLQAGYLFGATIVIETVFSLPGLGQLILNSTLTHDYPVIQASVLVLTLLFVATNLLTDAAVLAIDPRLRQARAA